MALSDSSKPLYIIRLVQFFVALAFLVLVCWSGAHRGWWKWWNEINGALAVGILAVLFTFATSLHGIVTRHFNRNPFSGGSTIRTVIRMIVEILTFLLWIAAATLLLRYPRGCGDNFYLGACWDPNHDPATENYPLSDRPVTEWDVSIAFSFVEIVLTVVTTFFVFREEKSGKSTVGGASYA